MIYWFFVAMKMTMRDRVCECNDSNTGKKSVAALKMSMDSVKLGKERAVALAVP